MWWALLPDEVLLVVIVGIGFALTVGLLSRGAAFAVIGMLLLFALLGPIAEGVMGELPPWIALALLVVFGLALLRGTAALVLGRRASDHMVGILAADCVRFAFRLLFLPFRAVGGLVRAIAGWV